VSNRDEFSDKIRKAVAARASWRCSFTGCQKSTVGPSEESSEAITIIGVAAHICAAAPGRGSRRYVASMSPGERAGIDNAIWLCADHATLVDRDEVPYTAEVLHTMKREHEAACTQAVLSGSSLHTGAGLTSGPTTLASMSLSIEDMASVGSTMAGCDLTTPHDTLIVTPRPSAMARLQRLHAAAEHLAAEAPEVARQCRCGARAGAELVQAMAACLITPEIQENRSVAWKA
jgi:hypothetical protein